MINFAERNDTFAEVSHVQTIISLNTKSKLFEICIYSGTWPQTRIQALGERMQKHNSTQREHIQYTAILFSRHDIITLLLVKTKDTPWFIVKVLLNEDKHVVPRAV